MILIGYTHEEVLKKIVLSIPLITLRVAGNAFWNIYQTRHFYFITVTDWLFWFVNYNAGVAEKDLEWNRLLFS